MIHGRQNGERAMFQQFRWQKVQGRSDTGRPLPYVTSLRLPKLQHTGRQFPLVVSVGIKRNRGSLSFETLKKEKNRFSHCAHDPRSSESIDLSWIFLPYVREKIYFVWRKYNRIFYSNRNFWKGKRRGFLPCIEIFFSIRAQI